jgi:hypothetical protein
MLIENNVNSSMRVTRNYKKPYFRERKQKSLFWRNLSFVLLVLAALPSQLAVPPANKKGESC